MSQNAMSQKRMLLGCFSPPPGHHLAAWRFQSVDPAACVDIQFYIDMVRKLEASCFDFFFLSDGAGIRTHYDNLESLSRWGRIVQFEPLTLMAALSVVTSRIGLVATASTSYNEPYNLARKLASLDLMSGGRTAWNIVTSVTDAEAQNFNRDHQLDHATRYGRAEEFLQVVTGLWRSWDQDAFVFDQKNGIFFDPKKARILNHVGEHFKVKGPLNVPRSPQGNPVLVQAGSSENGKAFAARWAEVMFTAQDNISVAIDFRREMRERAQHLRRDPDAIRVMPGVLCIVGENDEDAYGRLNQMQALVPEETSREMLKGQLGDVQLDWTNLDKPLGNIPLTNGSQSRQALLIKRAQTDGLSLRQLMNLVAVGRGHLVVVGGPHTIANQMEQWFREGAVDGFNVMPSHLPEGLDHFIEKVLPILQARGLVQSRYQGRTLRENLSDRAFNEEKINEGKIYEDCHT